jgi:hypothetical protein
VCDAHGTLVVHLLLVFVLHQTLHQIPRVDLVICHLLGERVRKIESGQEPKTIRKKVGVLLESEYKAIEIWLLSL